MLFAGRYSKNTSLVLVTHGLAARIFLMRWFHWTVEQFMEVYNPPNAEVNPNLRAAQCSTMCAGQSVIILTTPAESLLSIWKLLSI